MVLRTLIVLLLLGSGCLQAKPAPRLAQPAAVKAAYVLTYPDRAEVSGVPDEVGQDVAASLGARNLQTKAVNIEQVSAEYARKRNTQDRLTLLAQKAETSGEPFVLLVETTPRYYSLLNGRYRWDVDLRVTFAPTAQLDGAQTEDYQLTAMLDFEHQDEVEALQYTSNQVADRVARVVDTFLTGYDGAALAAKPQAPEVEEGPPDPLRPGAAIYFVMVDRFHNGDPANDQTIDRADPHAFHGGDLAGIAQKLSWLEGLGITTLWLSPVFEMRDEPFHGHGAFHGYWINDFGAIEDRFGGEDALKALDTALAERGMTMFLDVVLNHVAMDHPWVAEKPDWFHKNPSIQDWDNQEQLESYQVHGLPDLAQENPEVYDHLLSNSLHWLKAAHPAGFRLDAVKHVPAAFWQKYNAAVKEKAAPGFVMLGEDLNGDASKVAQTMRDGGFDAMFDFPLHFAMVDVFCNDAHPGRLAETLTSDRLYPSAVGERRQGLVTLLDNHDLPRILSQCKGDEGRVTDALKFMLTARGTPSFTWGTESGLVGTKEPDNRADMRFEEHAIGTSMKKWLGLRRDVTPLTSGRDVLLSVTPSQFVYARVTDGQTVVVAVNKTQTARTLDLPDAEWRNIDTGAKFREPVAPPGVSAFVADVVLPPPGGDVVMEFRVKNAPEGEVRIVGSGPELGNWDPMKAPTAGAVTLPSGAAFAYQPVVVNGSDVKWSGQNRYVLTKPGAVELSFSSP